MQAIDRSAGELSFPPLQSAELRGNTLTDIPSGNSVAIEMNSLLEVGTRVGRNKKMPMKVATRFTSGNRLPYERVIGDSLPVAPPKARNQPVLKLIADQRSQNLCSEEETVLELYHANLSMYQMAILVDQLWGEKLGLSDVSKHYSQAIREIEAWRERPIRKAYPYVFLASIELKCSCGLEKKQASVLMAEGVDENGDREVLGVAEATEEVGPSWYGFLQNLKARGLRGVRLFVGDRCDGLVERIELIFPGMHFQTSVMQFRNDVLARVPTGHLLEVQDKLGLMDESTDWPSASKLVARILADLKRLKLTDAAKFYETHVEETLNYLAMPREHWRGLRSNSGQTKILRSLRERTRMVGAFSDGASAVYLVSARLRHIEATVWSEKRYPWGRL